MAPTIKLTYFGLKARAEAIRQAFHVGGIEFEDKRIEFKNWKEVKPTTPLGYLPTLEVDGAVFTQSNAMLRYAGKLSGLYPSCPIEALKVDGIVDIVEDINGLMGRTIHMEDAAAKVPARETLIAADGKISIFLNGLNKIVATSGKYGYCIGTKLSIADLIVTRLVENYTSGILDGVPTSYMQQFGHLMQVMATTHSVPAVHDWNVKHNTPKIKVTYFDAAGRAETARLALAYGGIEFEDERLAREAFGALKPSLPYGQLPALSVGDKVIVQSSAINLYVGKLTGCYPQDPEMAVVVDEVLNTLNDVVSKIAPTFYMPDGPEKLAARAELAKPDGPMMQLITKLNARIGSFNGNSKGFVLGGCKPTLADFELYSSVKTFKSGALDGIPTTLYDAFENISAVFEKVGKLDAVVAWYAKQPKK